MSRQAKQDGNHFRWSIRQAYLADEANAVRRLIKVMKLDQAARRRIEETAIGLVEEMRRAKHPGGTETFLA